MLFKQVALVIFLLILSGSAFAQAPSITYQTPQHYLRNAVITPLAPTNTGGAVPATKYGQVSTLFNVSSAITGIAVDKNGNIFYEAWESHVIIKYTPAGVRSIFAGSGTAGTKNGQGTKANFNQPDGLVIDPDGNLFVGDQTNRLIRKITPGGYVTTIAGSGSIGSADGLGAAAGFYDPRGLALDAANNIYVADQGNNKIRKVTQAGLVTTYAGTGVAGFTNGPRNVATLNTPTGMGIDAAGNLYVADAANNAVRKITPQQDVTTFATGLNFPREVRLDAAGYAYVTNQNGNTISRISPAGVVTTLAGTGSQGKKDGPGNVATFAGPLGLAIDDKGNLYVGDNVGNAVRKIVITGYSIDKPLPAGLIFDTATGIISGTPTALSPLKNYTITAFNLAGASSTIVKLQVTDPLVSVITFPQPTVAQIGPDNILQTGATSNNLETPITYTSSNPDVAYVGADGQIHVIAPGQTTITANQAGNATYLPAQPVSRLYTIFQQQVILFPTIATKSTCDADFSANAISSNPTIPLVYISSNPAVATISQSGIIHIVSAGSTTITVSQPGNNLFTPALPEMQTLTVLAPVAPVVNIAPDVTAVCEGAAVTFTATPNVSGNLSYQWRVNGINAGTNSNKFTTIPIASTDVYDCVVTRNDFCDITGTSNSYTGLIINQYLTPSVTVSSTAGLTPVCNGTQITFTAVPINGGPAPVFQWQVNGITAGTNSDTFLSDNLNNGDVVTCKLTTGGIACLTSLTALSAPITANIIESPNPAPSINITAVNDVYTGALISFSAATQNIGATTNYQWQVNDANVGSNAPVYSSAVLKNGDKVSCIIVTDIACSLPATSNVLTLNLLPPASINIPNAFSPNSDGINDLWNIPALLSYPNCTVNVYDRKGTNLFQSKGYSKPWSGIYNGKALPTATYYYVIYLADSKEKLSGFVTILK